MPLYHLALKRRKTWIKGNPLSQKNKLNKKNQQDLFRQTLNNIIESDQGKLKRLIKPTLGFKSMKTVFATIKGFEVMRMFKKGRLDLWKYGQGIHGEIRLITDNFLTY